MVHVIKAFKILRALNKAGKKLGVANSHKFSTIYDNFIQLSSLNITFLPFLDFIRCAIEEG